VEVYIQDVGETNRSQAVYSVMNNAWVKKPSYENIQIDKDAVKTKYKEYTQSIDAVIKDHDLPKMKELITRLYNMREAGLSTGGEYSTENLVFKLLRATGYVSKLRSSINSEVDNNLNK
jgi:hypothetical protein